MLMTTTTTPPLPLLSRQHYSDAIPKQRQEKSLVVFYFTMTQSNHVRRVPVVIWIVGGLFFVGQLSNSFSGSKETFHYYAEVYKQTMALQPHIDDSITTENTTLPSFTELLIASGSDKYDRHHYEKYYEKWLEPYRHQQDVKFLEIGARDGKSLQLWSNYFTKAQLILGLGYGKSAKGVKQRSASLQAVDVYYGDQSKKETMDYLQQQGPWNVIIDDGSHVPSHMMYTLFSLWQSVEPGGLYVIEDLETNYWPPGDKIYGYKMNGTGIGGSPEYSAVSKLEQIQQVLVRHQIGAKQLTIMPGDTDICSIEWGMNIVAIRKCSPEEMQSLAPFQRARYDEERVSKWIEEAKRTNPVM